MLKPSKSLRLLSGISLLLLGTHCAGPGSLTADHSWAEKQLATLTLRQKIAQMLVYHVNLEFMNSESETWRELEELLRTDGIGCMHVYRGEAGMSMTLMNEIQKLARIPVLFEADIEYGVNQRFPEGTSLPPSMAIAATGDPENAFRAGQIAGREAAALGIRWHFAPVCDVNNNPGNPIVNTRSFGEDPELVGTFAAAYMRGLQSAGVAATAKHFPGHGDTDTDSHSRLASIPGDSSRLWSLELAPFRQVIEGGVEAVMVGHLEAPRFQPQPEVPASLSAFWIEQVLRRQLDFRGLVVTDALAMGAITASYTDTYALIEAVNAGCDVIIPNRDFRFAVDVLEKAVQTGLVPADRIQTSAGRMLGLKQQLGLHRSRFTDPRLIRKVVGARAGRQIAQEIAQESITMVKGPSGLLPLRLDRRDTLVVVDIYDNAYQRRPSLVARRLQDSLETLISLVTAAADPQACFQDVLDSIPRSSTVLVNAFTAPRGGQDRINLPEVQADFLRRLIARQPRVILVSFGNPYLIRDFPRVPVYLCAWKDTPLMQTALLPALLGKSAIRGRLPVSIPGIARRGEGVALPVSTTAGPATAVVEAETQILRRAVPWEVEADVEPVIALFEAALADSAWPGGVLLAARDGKIFLQVARGTKTYARQEPVQSTDIFDLASLTKVIATTSAVMKQVETGLLALDDPVAEYLPEFLGDRPQQVPLRKTVTVRHLLTHTSGLPPFKQFYRMEGSVQTRLDSVMRTQLDTLPGTVTVYSDIGLIILGKLLEKIAGVTLDEYCRREIFQPLGMNSTGFNPPASLLSRVVPTEYSAAEGDFIRGHVHDENAWSLGGVAGHAGLFSSAGDLAHFSQMMLNQGVYGEVRLLRPETVCEFTRPAGVVAGSSRCLGWDSPAGAASGGVYLSPNSFGHTGFTGTSLWIDPDHRIFVILLTNAVHTDRRWKSPRYFDWRQRLHAAVYESLGFTTPNPGLQWRERWQKP